MRLLALFPSRMNPEGIASYVGSVLGDAWEVTGAGRPRVSFLDNRRRER